MRNIGYFYHINELLKPFNTIFLSDVTKQANLNFMYYLILKKQKNCGEITQLHYCSTASAVS